jgi:hypothetical protein
LKDYDEAIASIPFFADAPFPRRGIARYDKGDLDGAAQDKKAGRSSPYRTVREEIRGAVQLCCRKIH